MSENATLWGIEEARDQNHAHMLESMAGTPDDEIIGKGCKCTDCAPDAYVPEIKRLLKEDFDQNREQIEERMSQFINRDPAQHAT